MTINATLIADSISHAGKRITTLQLRYPRFIHAEFMTHRAFSRNASSSRAIPVEKLIEDIIKNPAVPSYWGKNQKGMQAGEEIDTLVPAYNYQEVFADTEVNKTELLYRRTSVDMTNREAWLYAMDSAIEAAMAFHKSGYHKQIVNRLLEPFSHINVVVTATEWDNFFHLRDHPDAEPHIQELARKIKQAMDYSTPVEAIVWHLPYVTEDDWNQFPQFVDLGNGNVGEGYSLEQVLDELIKVSVARCARVSYLTHDGRKTSIVEDIDLYNRLVGGSPLHASPTEHQARPDSVDLSGHWKNAPFHGNLVGWIQYRKTLTDENHVNPID